MFVILSFDCSIINQDVSADEQLEVRAGYASKGPRFSHYYIHLVF